MSFERRPKVKNRDYKGGGLCSSTTESQTSPESYLLRKQKQLASILDGLLLMLVF